MKSSQGRRRKTFIRFYQAGKVFRMKGAMPLDHKDNIKHQAFCFALIERWNYRCAMKTLPENTVNECNPSDWRYISALMGEAEKIRIPSIWMQKRPTKRRQDTSNILRIPPLNCPLVNFQVAAIWERFWRRIPMESVHRYPLSKEE